MYQLLKHQGRFCLTLNMKKVIDDPVPCIDVFIFLLHFDERIYNCNKMILNFMVAIASNMYNLLN